MRAAAPRRAASFILAGRREDAACRHRGRSQGVRRGGAETLVARSRCDRQRSRRARATSRARFGEPDEVIIAYGVLGDQAEAERDLAQARALIDSNFTSAALWMLALLKDQPAGRTLTIVGIGSVAGDRGRASNFIYGSAKAAFDRFLEGLAHKFDGSPVRIVRVKPGFVDTPMTAGIKKGGPLWATPDQIAADIERAVAKGRRVVYTPWFWWVIMMIIRHLPWFVFRRLKV